MKLYSYIVARDYGFAPNPFHGICTLATCKPSIRASAQVGDWIVGTGSGAARYRLAGHLVFAMHVAEIMTFDQYWIDPRFASKRPTLHGSLKQAYGDNIYHRDPETGAWIQEDSHHSETGGVPRHTNIRRDTKTEAVLIGAKFKYWGGHGPAIPMRYRRCAGYDICHTGRGHKCNFPSHMVESFVKWMEQQGADGYRGDPTEFRLTHGLK
jgi:hypothetical protein